MKGNHNIKRDDILGFLDRLKNRFTKPKANVLLKIPKSTIELGDDLKGAIAVSSSEEFDATQIRAELRCIEKIRREKRVRRYRYNPRTRRKEQVEETVQYWDTSSLHSVDPEVCGKLHLTPGFHRTFPFRINIPAGGRESFDSIDGGINWIIKGVIAIDGRPDVTSDTMELQIIKSMGTVAKEAEVVMVSCEYCETLMPETTSSCPNCGAPRKAKTSAQL